jgi:hypothetical protein
MLFGVSDSSQILLLKAELMSASKSLTNRIVSLKKGILKVQPWHL